MILKLYTGHPQILGASASCAIYFLFQVAINFDYTNLEILPPGPAGPDIDAEVDTDHLRSALLIEERKLLLVTPQLESMQNTGSS